MMDEGELAWAIGMRKMMLARASPRAVFTFVGFNRIFSLFFWSLF